MKYNRRVITVSFSFPEKWYNRLNNIMEEAEKQEIVISRSSILLEGLKSHHKKLQKLEIELGLTPIEIQDL